MKQFIWITTTIALLTSCEKIFFDEEPSNNPNNNFEIFWEEFNNHYAQFEIRNIDWDSIYSEYKPLVKANTSSTELHKYLSEIVGFINDGHVNLYSPYGYAECNDCLEQYVGSRLINAEKYIVFGPSQEHGQIIEYRDLVGKNIGFIILKSFTGTGEGLDMIDERYYIIDEIIQKYSDKNGIIIDVRSNGGGNSVNAEIIASRFADKKRLFHRFYQKNGSKSNDFSDWYDRYIEPKGSKQFRKPVVVITSDLTFSSAEIFVMAMEVFPHVTIVGDTTGGGIGNPIYRELPNGWTYRLSTKVGATADGYIIEGKGIPPDYPIVNTTMDSINGNDKMLEKAIEIIEQ